MEFSLLTAFIIFTVAIFDSFKDNKLFFFLVAMIGAMYGLLEYALPLAIPADYLNAAKHGVELALMGSGFYGIFKKKMENLNK